MSFRATYLDYDELTATVQGWASEHPDIVRVQSLGTSTEGRELWLVTIGAEPDRSRPAVWVDGNMHASELAGSNVALAIAEDMISVHRGDPVHGLPAHVADRLREVVFHVLPRMSPDGAEAVLKEGRYVRSSPRDDRKNTEHPRWTKKDMNGDGRALLMRVRDDSGEFVESTRCPGVMLVRQLEDPGPYYKLYPEGVIENFDGHHIPESNFLSDNRTDLNRNFPWSWAPEHEQFGAGAYPTSEPESRAVVEFTSAHPNIFAWLNVHTFGGVFIRPLGHKPDNKMNLRDLALFRQLEAWAEECTGYPMVSGFEEFTYEPDKALRGDLTDYAYHQRGCVAYVVELWDLFRKIGMPKQKRFVEHYSHMDRDDIERLAIWDKEHNDGAIFPGWRPCSHPQLGDVEVGGVDPRIGLWNPPLHEIAPICASQSAAFLRVAALAPSVVVDSKQAPGNDYAVDVTVKNRGYLPTHILDSSLALHHNEPLYAVATTEGCSLTNRADGRRDVGHLLGWGRGRHDGSELPIYMGSRGSGERKTLHYRVTGPGRLHLRIGSCRVGWVEHTVEFS